MLPGFSSGRTVMLRSTWTAILLLAGGSALAALLLCVLAVRLVAAALLLALSGIRRRARCEDALGW
jgi:hypothetical protein